MNGIEFPPAERVNLFGNFTRGELIGAIKHYRAATGAGLAESKAAVETRRWKRDG